MWNTADQGYDEHDLPHIDVWGPANDINHAVASLKSDGTLDTDTYPSDGSGTSYATAHVTAAAAMWIVHHGVHIDEMYGNMPWMRVEAFRQLLKSSSKPIVGDQQPAPGTGILNINVLLNAPLPSPATLQKEDRLSVNMWA